MDNKYRNYSKGKSFKFSEWNAAIKYDNDAFNQDWVVTPDGKVWVCLKTNINVFPGTTDHWKLVLDRFEGMKWNRI